MTANDTFANDTAASDTAASDKASDASLDHRALFSPLAMGPLTLPNRVCMAPLTRNRANPDGTVKPMHAVYYQQRASAGLIISEATQIGPLGKGYKDTPGIYTDAHVDAWKTVTDAVHAGGGRIFCQLWHVGRISHVSVLPEGESPVAPSAIRADGQTFGEDGFVDCSQPRAMTTQEVEQLASDFAHAAQCAKRAGFDGVEVHAANGYLLDQFLHAHSNERTDQYGGSPENRARAVLEAMESVCTVFAPAQVGFRLSPTGTFNDMQLGDAQTYAHVLGSLTGKGLAYLHVMEKFPGIDTGSEEDALLASLRPHWTGTYMANGDYGPESSANALASGHAHAVAVGRDFIANPDLPVRWQRGAELTPPDQDTFYGGDETGYTDYPFLAEITPV